MAEARIILAEGHATPAATYTRKLLDGATKYGVTAQDPGRYLKKTAVLVQPPPAAAGGGATDFAY